jgi:hypothetical protein
MARSSRLAVAAAFAAALAACNLVAGLGSFHDVDCEPCDAGLDTGTGADVAAPFDATLDAQMGSASLEAGAFDADAFAPDAHDASTFETGAPDTGARDAAPSVDYRWARWVMPNGADSGLPNPASYRLVTSIDGGVLDNKTHLLWGTSQLASSFEAAAADCPPPWRVPTRIELVSILDTSGSPTLVNPVFSTVQQAAYWTSSGADAGAPWTVNFGAGAISTFPGSAVLCVQTTNDGGVP